MSNIFECKVTCTSEHRALPDGRPATLRIRLPKDEVERGDLRTVLDRIGHAFFPRAVGQQDNPRPLQPLNLYAAADVPITAETLKASLLGVDGLPPPPASSEGHVLLSYGPTREVTWETAEEENLLPDSRMFRTIIPPGGENNVSILYESEDLDNSLESLLLARQRASDRSLPIPKQEIHSFIMPLRALGRAQQNYKVHFDMGVGIGGKDELRRALRYGRPKNEGCIIRVVNDGSPMFFADGTFSRFGLGFKHAAYYRGNLLTVAARGEGAKDPTEIVEGTIDLNKWFERSAQGVQTDKQFPWRPVTRTISEPAEKTARLRKQGWEATDPELPKIKLKAEDNPTFFMAITAELKEVAVQQMLAEGGLRCLRHLRHMYFYLTRLPRLYCTPANDGYPCPEIHLHVATGRGLNNFRVDEPPWEEWPQAPESLNDDLLSKEDISSRLLRFVKAHSTLAQPIQLKKTKMRVQDGFCFGFTHPCLKGTEQDELPICLVVLRYLPDAGFGRLKEQLGIPGEKILDIYYKGRLVPLQDAIGDVDLMTQALARKLKQGKHAAKEKQAAEIIQRRYYGQIFMQGAMMPDQVDHTKFRLGFLLPLSKDSFKSHNKDAMLYYAVCPQNGEQRFSLSSDDDISSDFCEFHEHFEKTFEKTYKVSDPLTFDASQKASAWCTSALRTHSFYKKLTKCSGHGDNHLKIGDDAYEDVPGAPKLHSRGEQRYRTLPAKVVAFKVPKGELETEAASSYTGPNAQMVLQLLPKACFNDESYREIPIPKYSPMAPQETATMKRRLGELARAAKLKLKVLRRNGDTLPSSIKAGSGALDVVVYVSSNGVNILDWLNPTWDGTGPQKFIPLKVVQKIADSEVDGRPLDCGDDIEDRTGFKFSISKEQFKACGRLKVDYFLRNPFRPTLKADQCSHNINVEANSISKLRVTCPDMRLMCPTTLDIQGLDVCNNEACLPAPTNSGADGFSLVKDQPEWLQLEVLEVQRLQSPSQAKLVAKVSSATALQPTIFGDGGSMEDHIAVKGRLVHAPSGISGLISFWLLQGTPVCLDLASEETSASLENGACMEPINFKIKDACGCYVGLPMGWDAQLTIASVGEYEFLTVKKRCKVDGCMLKIPEGVLLDAGTNLRQPLKLEWRIDLVDEAGDVKASRFSRPLSLEPCKGKPRKVQLRHQDRTLEPVLGGLDAEEVSQCLERVDPSSWPHAEITEAFKQGTLFYKLNVSNGSTSSRRKVEDLRLVLQDDAGSTCVPQPQLVKVQLSHLKTWPRSCLDGDGCFTCINANPLQDEENEEEEEGEKEPDAMYRITYSLQQQGKPDISFFLVVRAVPPAASSWRWCKADSAGSMAEPSGEVELTVMQPLAEQLSWTAVDDQGVVRATDGEPLVSLSVPTNRHSGGCSNNSPEEGEIIQLCRLRPAGLEPLRSGPVQWDSQLCLRGRSGAKFVLQLSGNSLLRTDLQGQSLAGAPVSFSVHGLPGLASLPGSEASPAATANCLSLHQDVRQLCTVLKDAVGNVSSIPESWSNGNIHLRISANSPYNAAIFPSSRTPGMLPLEKAAGSNTLHVPPSLNTILHLSSTRACSEVKLNFELIVLGAQGGSRGRQAIFRHSTSATLPVAPSPQLIGRMEQKLHDSLEPAAALVAGTPWPQFVAHLHLVSEAGAMLDDAATLTSLTQCIQATLGCPQNPACELKCRVLDHTGVPKLVIGPPSSGDITASGTYTIHTAYTEKRPAEAAIVRGSSVEQLAANPLQFEVQSGAPADLRSATVPQRDLLSACNSASRTSARTCTTTIFERLDAQLVDSFGNIVRPNSQPLQVELSLSHVDSNEQPAGLERHSTNPCQAALPSLVRASMQTTVSSEGQLRIGPVALVEGSGRGLGTCRLRLGLAFKISTDVQLHKSEVFTFYDEQTTSAERIEAHACKARLDRARKLQSTAKVRHAAAVRKRIEAADDIARVKEAVEGALGERRAQQELQRLGKHAEAAAALVAGDGVTLQRILRDVLQQLDTSADPMPKSNTDSNLARSCLMDFKSRHSQLGPDVLGLALDLIACKDDTARRLAAWKLGAQVIVVVQRKEAQTHLRQFFRELPHDRRPHGVKIFSLDLLNRRLSNPEPLRERFHCQVGSLSLPAYLATFFQVKTVVPSEHDMHKRLLQTIIGNSIVLPDLARAQAYRQQVVEQMHFCPEILTVDGLKLGSSGEVTVGRDDSRDQAPRLDQLSWYFGGPLSEDALELQERLQFAAAAMKTLPNKMVQHEGANRSAATAQAEWEEKKREAEMLEAEHAQRQESLARHESAGFSGSPSAGPSTSTAPPKRGATHTQPGQVKRGRRQ